MKFADSVLETIRIESDFFKRFILFLKFAQLIESDVHSVVVYIRSRKEFCICYFDWDCVKVRMSVKADL